MSWFDASGFANLAKSALKEAQKTIDKALDIKDEEQKQAKQAPSDSADFFASWGLKNEEGGNEDETPFASDEKAIGNSIWGSFTGSFFDTTKGETSELIIIEDEPKSEEDRSPQFSSSSSMPENLGERTSSVPEPGPARRKKELREKNRRWSSEETGIEEEKRMLAKRVRKSSSNSCATHRNSTFSSGSDKRSLESVEILGSESGSVISLDTSSSSTAMRSKVNSDSVEILPDSSMTSPSSVEVLGDCRSDSSSYLSPLEQKNFEDVHPDSEVSDISPYESPTEEMKSLKNVETPSQESSENVEVVAEVDESDETSLAEDSYTSVSDSMTVMTVMESAEGQQFSTSVSLSDYSLNLSLDSLNAPAAEASKKAKKVSELTKSSTETESSNDFLISTDSSCEGTLIGSSSEDNAASSQSKVVDAPLTSSSYVKSMLADAMSEKSETQDSEKHDAPRESSPISSESRSDLVKIGSDQTTSGHTSGDELETATSSDIEIISSPNGDSSSTQSRQSPAKLQLGKSSDLLTRTLKTRGHSRELSEISVCSDDTNFEVEKLLKRIQEMTEILEARESKLIDVSRINMELHEQNNALKKQLDNAEKHVEHSQDLNQITDEYTQRLSALERKFQQTIRERDMLRKSLEQLKQETAARLSSSADMSTMNAEKEEVIKELREEGEKLSKQQLQQSNIIKKLRAKEKESDATMKNQKEQIEEQNLELDRLKRSLNAKEEVERSQIEAVHTLTAKTKKQEKEILSLQEKLDNTMNKKDAYKKSLDAAKIELAELTENLQATENELKKTVESAGESCQLSAQIEDLKGKLRQSEEMCIRKEETLKQGNLDLLKRLEAAESRNEELSESASTATKPLLRQLEQLQSSLSQKTNNFMKQERMLSEKVVELQSKLENTMQSNQSLKEENVSYKSSASSLEAKLNSKNVEREKLLKLNEEFKETNEKITEENERLKESTSLIEESYKNQVKELKREINSLENKLLVEKAATDAEKRKNHSILELQQQSADEEMRLSPTLSIERDSVSSANSVWQVFNEPIFETSSGRFPNVYDSLRTGSNSTSIIENMQAQLKQREGEIQQLQWELSRRNSERDVLNEELSSLSLKIEALSAQVGEVQELKANLNDIQTKYDALLQMYGEKVEETQELRLDLQDVKEMYKTQIDQLLQRDA